MSIIEYDLHLLLNIAQIVFADIILSGDNALVIGMAAAGLPATERRRAIFWGMMMAAVLRISFAVLASLLIGIKGILLAGGLLLTWVCWRFYKDLRIFNSEHANADEKPSDETAKNNTFSRALITILLADISMSIDNVIAVASIARENTGLLVFGLVLAIAIMAFCATLIMRVMVRYRWLSWLGLFFLIYLSGRMLYDGILQFWPIL